MRLATPLALRRRIAKLERALTPFADKITKLEEDADFPPRSSWGKTIEIYAWVEDLDRARTVLYGRKGSAST